MLNLNLNLVNDMLWPLLVCFVLVGIHAYLGIHVIARKVIFVDLALAQIAALGAVYGVFLGLSFDANPLEIKVISVCFTVLGALLFSYTRSKNSQVPHEAIIGIIYAIAMSLTILVTANLPHGADEVRQMLAGSILWVTPSQVVSAAVLYALIGAVHFFARKKFFLLSSDSGLAGLSGFAIKAWDFLFYATFGVVVTSSVGIAGVLLVFAYLIIPAVMGVMLAQGSWARLLTGWFFGLVASILGVVISYEMDLPSGPVIVVVLAVFLLLVALILEVRRQKAVGPLCLKVMLFVLLLALVVAVPAIIFRNEHAEHSSPDQPNSDEIDQELSVDEVLAAIERERDDFAKIEMAKSLLKRGDKRGFIVLKKLYESSDSEFAKTDIVEHLQHWWPQAPKSAQGLLFWLDQMEDKIIYSKPENKFIISVGKSRL